MIEWQSFLAVGIIACVFIGGAALASKLSFNKGALVAMGTILTILLVAWGFSPWLGVIP